MSVTAHMVRVLSPGGGRSTHLLVVKCGECGTAMQLSSSLVEGRSRWSESKFDCPTCRPRQTVVVRWEAS